ncbi:unnamed protein product [Arabis nemorensis]|uniref:Uncharacterized protein n=1 Tax=Arabis nemorensis TaxID=586526 RepID=A0A565CP94_9BRAS|nr:unnamed protein product [Arabis nemorensis]
MANVRSISMDFGQTRARSVLKFRRVSQPPTMYPSDLRQELIYRDTLSSPPEPHVPSDLLDPTLTGDFSSLYARLLSVDLSAVAQPQLHLTRSHG